MTIVSNDPDWWPTIYISRGYSYFAVASFIVVFYDWALIFGQEFELIWVSMGVSNRKNYWIIHIIWARDNAGLS
ncbi:hypothetical protein K503DRAFT_805181 [Rhizopogon vinicolor AM-OR11-026]|uniref:DUF6533 domain-containing protein n=1 Tax=Rhizopogon vinicolor AM-OR11-026 TaxID=1314800 RepID=A0A1B7MIR4_9AGAM|nr:hypothetical protein K503DRAFT_805181 [Rhizopogon vinicolor AM-OR11-026]